MAEQGSLLQRTAHTWHDRTFELAKDGTTREVKAEELPRSTGFYRAGHYSGHDATLAAKGLDDGERRSRVDDCGGSGGGAQDDAAVVDASRVVVDAAAGEFDGAVIRSDTGFPEDGDLAPDPLPDRWEWRGRVLDRDRAVVRRLHAQVIGPARRTRQSLDIGGQAPTAMAHPRRAGLAA